MSNRIYKAGDSVTFPFCTYGSGGQDTVADSTPGGFVSHNGLVDKAVSVTISQDASTQILTLPASGSPTITYNGQTTGGVAVPATAATIQTALNGLSSINSLGSVNVSGNTGGPYTVVFSFGTNRLMTGSAGVSSASALNHYFASYTIPASGYAALDTVSLWVTATVNSVAQTMVKDIVRLTTPSDLPSINSANKVAATLDPADVAGTPIGSVSGTPGPTSFAATGTLSSANGAYANSYLRFEAGSANAGLALPITSYAGSTHTFGFSVAWPATPTVGDQFVILGSHVP